MLALVAQDPAVVVFPQFKIEDDMNPKKSKLKKFRDIEKTYAPRLFAQKLRRLADCVERQDSFQIQIAGERISVPRGTVFNIEHERDQTQEEIEFQIKWTI